MTTYDIQGVLPEGLTDELRTGTNLLISGPPMIGKRQLAIRLLGAGHRNGEGILCVTTSQTAASLLDELEQEIPTLDRDRVGIVDCSGSDDRRAIEQITTERISSPGDLTGISISTAKLLQWFTDQDVSEVRHGLVSVSTLVRYLDSSTVFKFLHIYTSRISETEGLGVFTIDSESHDQQTISTITSEFDGAIDLRETEDGRELRIRGLPNADRGWHSYD